MDIKLIIIIGFSYLYAIVEIFMSVMQQSKRTKEVINKGDKASIWILMFYIAMGYFLSFTVGATKLGRVYDWDTFFAIGALMVMVGLFIRIRSILILKQHFTYTVTKIEGHELIETGFYKYIRHPGYLGQLFIFTGIATSMSNWLSILLMVIPVLVGFIYRIRVEERFMTEQMGQKYLDYQKRTKRLIPGIY
jgi:protein-S-isoprenylcysteine O-methyltransferase Ste14